MHAPQISCCFSGYRPGKLPWGNDENDPRCRALKVRLRDVMEAAYDEGYRHFICGMAQGCDLYFCELALQLRGERPDMTIELPFIEVFGRGGSLKSSWYGDCLPSRDFPMLVDLHLQGRLPLDKFVSETIGLDAVEEAFHKMERGEVLRSVVVI